MNHEFHLTDFAGSREVALHVQMADLRRDFPLHTHDFLELVVILGGSGIHVIDGEEYPLGAGDVFVVGGRLVHGFRCGSEGLRLCNLMFDPRIFQSAATDLRTLPGFQSLFVLEPYYRRQHGFRSRLTLDAGGLACAGSMVRLLDASRAEDRPGIARLHFLSLVAFLSRSFTGAASEEAHDVYLLAEAVAHMESCCTQPLRVSDLAARAHLSERHFLRVFERSYHVSPLEYVQRLRTQHARRLMEETDWSLSRIATESGFYDISAFTRRFRRETGTTPGRYRRRSARGVDAGTKEGAWSPSS